jgi:hypothetical protein
MTCNWIKSWVGPCDEESVGEFCKEHLGLACCSCGEQSTHDCEETFGLVCGHPLCDNCEHTIRENGCNSGAPLPEGLGGHCRKDEQVYKPWYMRKEW